jgi:hypothetical protein
MNGLFIFVAIVILSAIIGAVSQALKNQQQAEQARRAQARAANRGGGGAGAGRAGASDIDRFLEEIDKLRRKSTSGERERERPPAVPVARRVPRPTPVEVPTVSPRKMRPSEETARTFEVTAAVALPSLQAPLPRLEDLPTAPVGAARPIGTPPPQTSGRTEFATQLGALLGSHQALPLAVVLQEVLGPPKSKRT